LAATNEGSQFYEPRLESRDCGTADFLTKKKEKKRDNRLLAPVISDLRQKTQKEKSQ